MGNELVVISYFLNTTKNKKFLIFLFNIYIYICPAPLPAPLRLPVNARRGIRCEQPITAGCS